MADRAARASVSSSRVSAASPQANRRLVHLPEFGRVDIDVDNCCVGLDQCPAVCADLSELAAGDKEHVGVADKFVGDAGEAAAQPEGERMIVAERTFAADRAGRWDAALADEPVDLNVCLR